MTKGEFRTVDALGIRRRLGREAWRNPEQFGPDGWRFWDRAGERELLVTGMPLREIVADVETDWLHASMVRVDGLPTYDDLVEMHRGVWGDGYAYQMFVPPRRHVNIHANALHLWGRLDGEPCMPDFGAIFGSI